MALTPNARTAPAGPVLRAQRRRQRGSIWTDRSARVHFMRRALPISIGLLVLLLLGWIIGRSILTKLGERNAATGEIRMLHPKFYGRNGKGQAYTVNAVTAVRDGRDPNQITLERPIYILQTGAPKPTVMQAATGLYRDDTRNLILSGQVVMDDAAGNRFESERALIDTVAGVVTGETAISGVGPLGQITASSYAIYDGGARVVFTGSVKAHVNNADKRR